MEVLQLVLQHLDVKHSIASVCSLLMVGKALQQPVHAHLQRQLTVCMPRWPNVQQVARWLSKHCSLLRHLDLNLQRLWYTPEGLATRAFEVLAAALRDAAAAAPGRLQLQSLSYSYPNNLLLRVLEQTCSASLTSLRFGHSGDLDGRYKRVPDALLRLTALRSLIIETRHFHLGLESSCDCASTQMSAAAQHERWLQPLSSLLQLTSLTIIQLRSATAVQHLPVKLQQLELRIDGMLPMACQNINICYLRALTGLITNFQPAGFLYNAENGVMPGIVSVPTTLQLLAWHEAPAAAPVLGSTQLPRLQLSTRSGAMPASELCLLSSLTRLTDIHLRYPSIGTAAEAAAAWRGLPVKQLTVQGIGNSVVELERFMRDLGGLTSLSLHYCTVGGSSLTVVAAGCSNLQWLSLRGCSGITGAEFAPVLRLQQLRLLDVTGTDLPAADLQHLRRSAPWLRVEADSSTG
jgi:hypothetical protein